MTIVHRRRAFATQQPGYTILQQREDRLMVALPNRIIGSIGAQTNAATSLDYVWYDINTTSDQAPVAIDLLSDWIRHNIVSEAAGSPCQCRRRDDEPVDARTSRR